MTIILSVLLSLVAGVYIMYQTQYFWGKEDNPNICNINNSLNLYSDTFGSGGLMALIMIVVLAIAVTMIMSFSRAGF